MSNTALKCAATMEASNVSACMQVPDLICDSKISNYQIPTSLILPSTRIDASELSTQPRKDPDGWLVDALAKLPPGDSLHEAWQQGPDSLFKFLNALWVAELLYTRTAPRPLCTRLDIGFDRMKTLADMDNDDVPGGGVEEIADAAIESAYE